MKRRDYQQITSRLSKYKPDLKKRFKVKRIGLFGSYLRNMQRSESDIDILIELSQPVGLFTLIRLEEYLKDILGSKKIDLVTKNSLKPHIGKRILNEVIFV